MMLFTRLAGGAAEIAGKPIAFAAACLLILSWAAAGPLFGFSQTWQLVVNTGTTITTFLMIFLVQNAQNRDAIAIQVKLDELLSVTTAARTGLVGIEHGTDGELRELRERVERGE